MSEDVSHFALFVPILDDRADEEADLVAHREIARVDWQHDGVLILFRDGRRLLIPTCRLPRSIGPSGHYPEIGQAVQTATFAVLRHNHDLAERIRWECERVGGPSYRHAPRFTD